MMLLKTIIATFATATLFFASLAEGHALSLVPMAAVATLLLAAKESMALTIGECVVVRVRFTLSDNVCPQLNASVAPTATATLMT